MNIYKYYDELYEFKNLFTLNIMRNLSNHIMNFVKLIRYKKIRNVSSNFIHFTIKWGELYALITRRPKKIVRFLYKGTIAIRSNFILLKTTTQILFAIIRYGYHNRVQDIEQLDYRTYKRAELDGNILNRINNLKILVWDRHHFPKLLDHLPNLINKNINLKILHLQPKIISQEWFESINFNNHALEQIKITISLEESKN